MIRKTFSLLLALLVSFTHMGIAFGTHYCGGKAVKSAFLLGPGELGCGMESMEQGCDNHSPQAPAEIRDGCCENDYNRVVAEDRYNVPSAAQAGIHLLLTTAFLQSAGFTHLFIPRSSHSWHSAHAPPRYGPDIRVLFQSFLL